MKNFASLGGCVVTLLSEVDAMIRESAREFVRDIIVVAGILLVLAVISREVVGWKCNSAP